MTNGNSAAPVRAPKLLWVIGVVALLWNALGALDYTMTQTRNQAYLAAMPKAQLDYLETIPAWVVAAWAIGVWGGLVGSILLLARKGAAVPVFGASFAGALLSQIHTFGLSKGYEVMGGTPTALIFPVVICAVALGLVLYARAMRANGVIR